MPLTATSGAALGRPIGFDQVIEAYHALCEADVDVVVASPHGGEPPLRDARRKAGQPFANASWMASERQAREALSETLAMSQVFADDFTGALCLGAVERRGFDGIRDVTGTLIGALLAGGKPVAAIQSDPRLAYRGPSEGLLILGDQPRSSLPATYALLVALGRTPKAFA